MITGAGGFDMNTTMTAEKLSSCQQAHVVKEGHWGNSRCSSCENFCPFTCALGHCNQA